MTVFDGSTWSFLDIPGNGRITNEPHAILVDTVRGLIWIGTNRGLKVFNPNVSVAEHQNPLSVTPQIAISINKFRFFLPEDGFARFSIFDIAGRKVSTPVDGQFSKGWHLIILSSSLRNGIYLIKGKVLSGKILKRE